MSQLEGVIRFNYELRAPAEEDRVPARVLQEMNAARQVLRRLGLIGRDAARYDGLGYGNLSVRAPGNGGFWITASQTGGLDVLGAEAVCRIDAWDVQRFRLVATGTVPPSSEAITHAMIYGSDVRAACVLHAHDRTIWRDADRLGLPATSAEAGYGSPAMAASVQTLLELHTARPLVFVTPGHEDGVFAIGPDVAAAAGALVSALVRAVVGPAA